MHNKKTTFKLFPVPVAVGTVCHTLATPLPLGVKMFRLLCFANAFLILQKANESILYVTILKIKNVQQAFEGILRVKFTP